MRPLSRDFEWNGNTIQHLKSLWAEGHSAAEIGRRLGISKNAVIGKAGRLHLTARPSPIRAAQPDKAAHVRRQRRPSLVELREIPPSKPNTPPEPAPKPIRQDTLPASPPVLTARNHQPCCWPIGEPGKSGFRFCNAPNAKGKPYCPAHCIKAYPRRRDNNSVANPTTPLTA
jgi:GcrA cell cycle regulator